ncbi:MAG TPA: hypothetical protein VD908_10470 [Cytophagales bacterium]|nr:hypothetical protein [Cytophagales bacterium]
MSTIHYKRLCEVRILHEYYLSKNDLSEYFGLTDLQRAQLLDKKLFYNQYDIWNDLLIEPSKETAKAFSDHHIKFVPQKSGFLLGIEVKLSGSSYVPLISLDENKNFHFIIRLRNAYFKNFSNLRLQSNIPSIYYFSNANPDSNKVFSSLSTPVENFKNGLTYEAGEISKIGVDIKEAIIKTNTSDAANWRKIISTGFAHEGDRIALPFNFYYEFDKATNVKQADFTLKDPGDVTIKSISVSKPTKLEKVLLDFSKVDETIIKRGTYKLEVSGENGYQDTRKVYLDDFCSPHDFGIIEIQNKINNSDFSIYNLDGSLKNSIPVFEIRIKSRKTYWRYKSANEKSLAVTPKTNPYLTAMGGQLRSKTPLPMIALPIEFRDPDPMIPRVFLPNPTGNSIKPENDGRIYSDIYISKIKDLITETI